MAIKKIATKEGELRYKAELIFKQRFIKSKTFRRKIDAQTWVNQERLKLERGDLAILDSKISLSEFFDSHYLPNAGISEATKVDYIRIFNAHFRPTFGHRNLNDIKKFEWAQLLSKLSESGFSNARLNRIQNVASTIYAKAMKLDFSSINPLRSISRREEPLRPVAYWTANEAQTFLKWASENSPERFLLYWLAYETGLRISELLALKRDSVDLHASLIKIFRSQDRILKTIKDQTKSGRERMCALSPSLKGALEKLLQSHSHELLFLNSDGTPMKYEWLLRMFKKDQIQAGVKLITPHCLRHTFASHYVAQGGNIVEAQAALGHADINTTMRYVRHAAFLGKGREALVRFEHEP